MKTVKHLTAQKISPAKNGLMICMEGRDVVIPWENLPEKVKSAPERERCNAVLSPGGYGVHWPGLDEDLTIQGLMRRSGH
jgi:hypothetical protein